jgi:hypothetical protein
VFKALFQKFHWNKICLLGTTDVFGRGIVTKLREIAPNLILFDSYFSADRNQYSDCFAALTKHLQVGCRIFVFNGLAAAVLYAMQAAQQLGILNNPKVRVNPVIAVRDPCVYLCVVIVSNIR